jgi:signal peptidase I
MSTRPLVACVALAAALSGCGGSERSAAPSARLRTVYVSQPHYTGYHMPSSSMEPTLHCGRPGFGCQAAQPDRLLVDKTRTEPARGDVVVFRTPPQAAERCGAGGVFVKRVVALPGETWEERRGRIYADGKPLPEPYVRPGRRDDQTFEPAKLADDAYALLGDNRASSCDSRVWGPVPKANIIGTVVVVYRQR